MKFRRLDYTGMPVWGIFFCKEFDRNIFVIAFGNFGYGFAKEKTTTPQAKDLK